jgi:outer membrane protein assembly factor BamE (lipoprotein component of BamABCDE complex)
MKSNVSRPLAAVTLAITLGACASAGTAQIGDSRFASVARGLTQDQVRSLEGTPTYVTGDAGSSGESDWIYSYTDTWGMRSAYDVTFDSSGHVARTSSMRLGF